VSNDQSQIAINILVITLLVALFGDLVLRSVWNKMYFKVGLPIFVLLIPMPAQYTGVPVQYFTQEELQQGWFTPLLFKQIGTHMYAFREKAFHWGIRYFPVMHGLLIFDNTKQRIVVLGFANWFTIWLGIYFLIACIISVTTFSIEAIGSVAVLVLMFLIWYPIQHARFTKVGKIAVGLCSSSTFPNSAGV
jgi:hypothetical protein